MEEMRAVGPCIVCGTTSGRVGRDGIIPRRLSLDAFGIRGEGCISCYDRLRARKRRGRHPLMKSSRTKLREYIPGITRVIGNPSHPYVAMAGDELLGCFVTVEEAYNAIKAANERGTGA